jgi:hypothetical protein
MRSFSSVGQVAIDRGGVGEQGVAAQRRHVPHAQHPAHRRRGAEGDVGVPLVGGADERHDLLAQLHAVGGLDVQDLGKAGHVGGDRMPFQVPEISTETDMILMTDVLVSKEHHLVAQQRGADRGDDLRRQRLTQVQAGNFGAENRADGGHRKAGIVRRFRRCDGGKGVHGVLPERCPFVRAAAGLSTP